MSFIKTLKDAMWFGFGIGALAYTREGLLIAIPLFGLLDVLMDIRDLLRGRYVVERTTP